MIREPPLRVGILRQMAEREAAEVMREALERIALLKTRARDMTPDTRAAAMCARVALARIGRIEDAVVRRAREIEPVVATPTQEPPDAG